MYSLLGVAILEENDDVSREFCLPPAGPEKGPRAVCFVRGMALKLQLDAEGCRGSQKVDALGRPLQSSLSMENSPGMLQLEV
jgi:hypothetical protein